MSSSSSSSSSSSRSKSKQSTNNSSSSSSSSSSSVENTPENISLSSLNQSTPENISVSLSSSTKNLLSDILDGILKECSKSKLFKKVNLENIFISILTESKEIIEKTINENLQKKVNTDNRIKKIREERSLPACEYIGVQNKQQCNHTGKVEIEGKFYCKPHSELASYKYRCCFIVPSEDKGKRQCGNIVKIEVPCDVDLEIDGTNYNGEMVCSKHSTKIRNILQRTLHGCKHAYKDNKDKKCQQLCEDGYDYCKRHIPKENSKAAKINQNENERNEQLNELFTQASG